MSFNFLHKRVGHLVRRLQQISVGIFLDEVSSVVGVTPVQFAALTAISEHPRLDIQRLANLVAVDRATVGAVITRLVKSKLVERVQDPLDRRSRVVKALAAGQRVLQQAAPHVRRADLRLAKPFTELERDVFLIYMRQLVHAGNDFSSAPLITDQNVERTLSLYSRPGYLVRRLQQVCEGIFADEVAELAVTPAQYAALAVVSHARGADNTTIAHAVALDKATTGSIIRRLSARGLIKVRSSPTDKRSKNLIVTDAGEKLLAAIQPRLDRADERVLSALSKSDHEKFVRLLHKAVEFNNEKSRAPLKLRSAKGSKRAASETA